MGESVVAMFNEASLVEARTPIFPPADIHAPTVLLVDESPVCNGECQRLLDDLGYRHAIATSTRDVLDRISADPSIEIVLIDVEAPGGFRLIEEARARLLGGRALAVVLLARAVTAEIAVRGMHVEAADLICKPLDLDSCSKALRRAMRYLASRRQSAEGAQMTQFTQRLGHLVAALEGGAVEPPAPGEITNKQMSATLQNLIATRGLRGRYFQRELFADPAWDILLDLTRAQIEGQQVSVSSVCIAASVPMSTALRWVRQMTEAGLLRRWTDPKDRRRDLIALTDATAAHMKEYLGLVHRMARKG